MPQYNPPFSPASPWVLGIGWFIVLGFILQLETAEFFVAWTISLGVFLVVRRFHRFAQLDGLVNRYCPRPETASEAELVRLALGSRMDRSAYFLVRRELWKKNEPAAAAFDAGWPDRLGGDLSEPKDRAQWDRWAGIGRVALESAGHKRAEPARTEGGVTTSGTRPRPATATDGNRSRDDAMQDDRKHSLPRFREAAERYAERVGVPPHAADVAVRWLRLAAERGRANAQFNLGVMYRDGGDDREAVRWLRLAAEQGHAEAQNNLGAMYEAGRSAPQDGREAARWLQYRAAQGDDAALLAIATDGNRSRDDAMQDDRKHSIPRFREAAERGHTTAARFLARSYAAGVGVPQDAAEAYYWAVITQRCIRLRGEESDADTDELLSNMAEVLTPEQKTDARRRAAAWTPRAVDEPVEGAPQDDREAVRRLQLAVDQGDAGAQFTLGVWYAIGRGVLKDAREAVRLYRLAADQGHADAQTNLGVMYREGLGVPQDEREAVRWFRLAAEQGDDGAQYLLGFMYAEGRGVPEDDREAVRWYRLAAAQGDATAQTNLGGMYGRGEGVPQDDREAVRWYRLAAAQGDATAQFNLGVMYAAGRGVPQDDEEAVRWYRLAADQGDADAQNKLGAMYAAGRAAPQDDREAVRWLQTAAGQGDTAAQNVLGFMYAEGRGVPKDDREAVRWYRLAADQGHADAQNNLGVMYDDGRGVSQDIREAVRWYRRAAEQGNAGAQFNLGFMYAKGEGVPQDDREAVRLYRLAADQGYARAQFMLGSMYASGRGVRQDDREAVRWCRLAAEQGLAAAQTALERLEGSR